MSARKRMLQDLFADKGIEVQDVKFFLGEDRHVSVEALCEQVSRALTSVRLGQAKLDTDLDKGIAQAPIEQFLGA